MARPIRKRYFKSRGRKISFLIGWYKLSKQKLHIVFTNNKQRCTYVIVVDPLCALIVAYIKSYNGYICIFQEAWKFFPKILPPVPECHHFKDRRKNNQRVDSMPANFFNWHIFISRVPQTIFCRCFSAYYFINKTLVEYTSFWCKIDLRIFF